MKRILLLCLIVSGVVLGFWISGRVAGEHFGADFKGFESVQIKDALSPDEQLKAKEISLSGVITRQCPSSGCWFYIKDDSGNQIKIELGHLGLKFPQRSGSMVLVEGKLIQKGSEWQLIGNGATFGGK
ncbi:MAG: hypothetical protein ACOYXC_03030 [Candidatus Rifleibacteriota bacterium]